jgi:hypothetical protein
VGRARMFVEVDAGTGLGAHVIVDLKITVRPGNAGSVSHVVRALEPPSAEFSDQQQPDHQPVA